MKHAPVKIDERAAARYGRKQAIPQWLRDLKAQPLAEQKAAAKAQLTPAQMADRVAELTELALLLLEESDLND